MGSITDGMQQRKKN